MTNPEIHKTPMAEAFDLEMQKQGVLSERHHLYWDTWLAAYKLFEGDFVIASRALKKIAFQDPTESSRKFGVQPHQIAKEALLAFQDTAGDTK